MRLTGYLFAIALLLLHPNPAKAQEAMPVQMDLDHAAFAYNEGASLLEVYLAIEAISLYYEADSLGFRASLPVDMAVYRSTEATLSDVPQDAVWSDSLTLNFLMADTTGLVLGQHFVHQVRAAVPPGEYEIQVTVPANLVRGRQELMLRRDIIIPDYSEAGLVSLSDLTLASSIQRSEDRDDLFFKNGLVIRPNANQLFGGAINRLYYYVETYNAPAVAGDGETYTVFAYIAEANLPQPLPDLQRRLDRPTRSPDVIVGFFDLDQVPSGSYFLRIAVLNEDNESVVEQARKFFVYNPSVARVEEATGMEMVYETSPYAAMTKEEVDKAGKHIGLIATDRERRRFNDIEDLDERRRFLMDFWMKRDPNPGTPVNEYKEEFYQLLQYANDRYTNSYNEGWDTDRGRVLIKYGVSSNVEPHLYDRGMKPYEIWEFNNISGEGKAIFIFADLDGFGSFELIHSTVSGERKLVNWQEEIRQ